MASADPANPYAAVELNFSRTRRNTKDIRFLFKDSANAPIDNTGHTYKMEGDPDPAPADNAAVLFEMTYTGTGDGLAIFSPTSDEMDPRDAEGADVNPVFYDVEVTVAGKTFTPVRGQIDFDPNITDAEED